MQIDHLETILTALDIARQEEDLQLIKQELIDSGYMKSHAGKKNKNSKAMPKSKPLHFRSSDGYDMYVGKNNYQNDMLTFKTATGNDWWFHVKQAPGSHVIVQCNNEEPPIRTFEEAASLAAHFHKKHLRTKLRLITRKRKMSRNRMEANLDLSFIIQIIPWWYLRISMALRKFIRRKKYGSIRCTYAHTVFDG